MDSNAYDLRGKLCAVQTKANSIRNGSLRGRCELSSWCERHLKCWQISRINETVDRNEGEQSKCNLPAAGTRDEGQGGVEGSQNEMWKFICCLLLRQRRRRVWFASHCDERQCDCHAIKPCNLINLSIRQPRRTCLHKDFWSKSNAEFTCFFFAVFFYTFSTPTPSPNSL